MAIDTKISLYKNLFSEKEKLLCSIGALTASIFKYESGVECVRITNRRGYITVLPYNGQQIWRAVFDDHDLVMRSLFPEPTGNREYLRNYGAFLIHCGLTAIGNPAENDTHPLHGELPNTDYKNACIICGEDKLGKYIEISGNYEYNIGFESGYRFTPHARLYENATEIKMTVEIENLRSTEQEYLYMCHMNFMPVDGSRLVYSAKKENIYTHYVVPDNLPEEKKEKLEAYFKKLGEDVTVHNNIDSETQFYDPEIVFTVKYEQDDLGRGYCMQVMPDGYAGFVSHRPSQLPYGVRWIARNPEEDAIGMLLPATGEHNGYHDCKEKGYIRYLPAYGKTKFEFEVGLLTPPNVKALENKINKMINN